MADACAVSAATLPGLPARTDRQFRRDEALHHELAPAPLAGWGLRSYQRGRAASYSGRRTVTDEKLTAVPGWLPARWTGTLRAGRPGCVRRAAVPGSGSRWWCSHLTYTNVLRRQPG